MKLVHTNWNNETVNNTVIVGDLERMSGGKLKISEESNLDLLAKEKRSTHQQRDNERSGGGKRRQKGGGGQQRNKNFKTRHKK